MDIENKKENVNDINFQSLMEDDKAFNNTGKNNDVAHINRLTRVIREMDKLASIIDSISKIDYPKLYYAADEFVLKEIKRLREALERCNNEDNKKVLRDELRSFEPGEKEKFVILIDEMLKIIEEKGLGFGINNTFPYFYNGYMWEVMPKEFAKEVLALVAQNSGFKHYYIRVHKRIEDLFKQFCQNAYIPIPKKDTGIIKINLANGKLTIKNGKPLFEPIFLNEDFFKYQLPFGYDPTATAPKFQKYLDRVLPEKDAQAVLCEYLGYIFSDLKLEKCLVLVGPGHSGKSVLHDIVNALLGVENVSSYTLNNLCNENGYYRAELTNVLVNYCSELGGKGCNPDTVKQLISGEPVSCRSPYGEPFILRNYCRFMFNTNLIPKDIEQTNAYFRRFIFLTFDQVISAEERNVNLAKEIIDTELAGVFNMVLAGLERIVKNQGFTKSAYIDNAMETIKTESSSVALFMSENGYEISTTEHIEKKSLFMDYQEYCKNNGYFPVSNVEFSRRLNEIGYKVEGKHTNNATWVFCKTIGECSQKEKEDIDNTIEELFKITKGK